MLLGVTVTGVYDGPLKQLSNSTRTKVIAVEYVCVYMCAIVK